MASHVQRVKESYSGRFWYLEPSVLVYNVGSGYQLRLLSVSFFSTVLKLSGPNALRVGCQVGVTMKESLPGSSFCLMNHTH